MTEAEGHALTAAAEPTYFVVRAYRALRPREGYAVVTLRGVFAAALFVLGGLLAVLGWGVYVLRPWSMIVEGFRWLVWWLEQHTALTPLQPLVPAPSRQPHPRRAR